MRLLIILLISSLTLKAQYRNEFGGSIGTSNYLGDIGGASQEGKQVSPSDLKIQAQRFTTNGYYRYKLNKDISLRTSLIYTRLYGNDALTTNPSRRARNLSFKTDVIELLVTGEWNFYQQTRMTPIVLDTNKTIKRKDFRAFIFSGVGAIYFNPRAELLGKTYNLRPLKTEGVSYKPYTWTIPIGMGLSYTINKKWRFGADMSYRITGTDWLDDVSGNYNVSYSDGLRGYDAVKSGSTDVNDIRMALGNRTSEVQSHYVGDKNYNPSLPIGANYDVTSKGGTPRGGNYKSGVTISERTRIPYKDGYVTFNLSVGYVIKGKNQFYKEKSNNKDKNKKIIQRTGVRF
jgi:hypothetical protein